MIDVNVGYERHVGARLLDFFGSTTPWHRSLWTLGLVLTLNELLEATEAVRRAILRQNSVEDLSRMAMSLAGSDPGAGAVEQRRTLQAALRTELRYQGMDYRVVQQLVADIEPNYGLNPIIETRRTNPLAVNGRSRDGEEAHEVHARL